MNNGFENEELEDEACQHLVAYRIGCDEPCRCGHACRKHIGSCWVDGCDCQQFEDAR